VREKRERERGEEEEREREERGVRMMPAQRLFFSRFGRTKPARAFLPQTAKYDETAPVSLSPPPHTGPLGALPGGRARARHPLPAVAARGKEEREKERKEKGRERPGSRRL
jgi:hypothetical protein